MINFDEIAKEFSNPADKKADETSPNNNNGNDSNQDQKESEVEVTNKPEEVDELSLFKDKDGNLVDAENKIVYNKGTFEIDNDGNVKVLADKVQENNFFDVYKEVIGEEYKADVDIKTALHDVAESIAENFLQEKIEKLPTVARNIINLMEDSKALSEYLRSLEHDKVVDYSTFSIPASDRAGREDFVRKQISKTNPDFVDTIMNTIKDKNEVDKYFDNYLNKLKETQQAEIKQQKELEKEKEKAEKEKAAKIYEEVKTTLSKPILGGKLILDKKEQETLLKGTFERDKEGYTEIDRKLGTLNYEQTMLLNYLILNNFNLDKMIDRAILDRKKSSSPTRIKVVGTVQNNDTDLFLNSFKK